ncbi:uncharacterized protein MJAP1_002396 [Malassezia japonica]|uniref:SAP domain-containing protein n=1 Tax=Malassezia japonica TaxID=223818 RepID=A0AAF0JB17_9BASI|nr:uncharacterized protein MJAP1_002396 [Malassezia japonica]WFD39419.1 hypothetical protein MJAP1_002396 [Malassezia japonica]
MEAQLQSLKVPELKDLLQKASLPITGNKPDLIKRLLENPAATASLGGESTDAPSTESEAAPAAAPVAPAAEAAAPAAAPAAAAPAAADAPKADAPADAPADETADAPAAEPAQPSQEERTQAHLAELEKRKARALRFGQPTEELEKEIERVAKFGLPTTEGAASERVDGGLKKRAPPAQDKKAPKAAKTEAKKPAEPAAPAAPAVSEEELARRQRRAERFGLVNPAEEDKKRSRAERFGAAAPSEA